MNARATTQKDVTRTLTFQLTESDFAVKARILAELNSESCGDSVRFEALKKHWKRKIEDTQEKISDVMDLVLEGEEARVVECLEIKDFDRNLVSYSYKGEIMEERAMTVEERQLEMIPREPEQARPSSDIQDVIRDETNVKTKQASV